ncbi:MAG: sulfatase-like hydrolase/transferase [Planctomycetota bacterium]
MAQTPRTPSKNVVLIMTDQHNAACTGYENHPQALTPHLDRLAEQGTRFRHAYTPNPICLPTRVSLLSGQYCQNHGYYGLTGPTPTHLPSFLGHFRAHGYATAAIGKLHLPKDPRGWAREDCDVYHDTLANDGEGMAYRNYLKRVGFAGEVDARCLPEFPEKGNYTFEARPSRMPFEHSIEGFTNQQSLHFMDEAVARGQPFCMEVSYHRPHQVYTPAQAFWDLYDDDLELPPFALDDSPGRPPHFLETVAENLSTQGLYEPKDLEARMRRVWKGYLACVSHCDHAVGQVLDHLTELGVADDTIVVYTADHGAYSGTFGLSEKAPGICSEQVCRVPYLWRVPGVAKENLRVDELAHLVDLAPTAASLAGLPAMDWVDGVDLSPWLRGGDGPIRGAAVTENPWSKSVRWDRWRLVHYQPEMFPGQDLGELYDLEADPWERNNLYADPAHAQTLNHGRRLLLEWLIDTRRPVTTWPNLLRDGQPVPQARDGKQSNAYTPDARRSLTLNYL